MHTPFPRGRFWALAILLLAAALRLYNLTYDSLWFDEALTRATAIETMAEPAAALAVRDHLPLLYWLTAVSLRLLGNPAGLGDDALALRLPSALAGVLAVAAVMAFGRVVGRPRAGLWAGLLLAVSPLAIRHAQEARHYSLLLLVGLLALYWLYRALDHGQQTIDDGQKRDGRRQVSAGGRQSAWSLAVIGLWLWPAVRRPSTLFWLAFGIAASLTLMTHYSGWLWLVGLGVGAVAWAALAAYRDRFRVRNRSSTDDWDSDGDSARRWAWVAATLPIGLALLLLLPGAIEAFRANTEQAMGTTAAAPLGAWLRAMGLEFGLFSVVPAVALALLAVAGGVALARRRPGVAVLLGVAAVVPVVLIQLLGITRFALPKYVIYLLPVYLFLVGVTLAWLTTADGQQTTPQKMDDGRQLRGWRTGDSRPTKDWSRIGAGNAGRSLSRLRRDLSFVVRGLLVVAVILAVALPAIAREHALMVHDWRGAAGRLAGADVVLAVALDTGDGFNAGGVMAPIYLNPAAVLLDGNHLTADDLAGLAGRAGEVSALVLNLYGGAAAGGWETANHQGSLYSLRRAGGPGDVLEQIAELYRALLPQAIPPAACGLAARLAEVELARGELEAAEAALATTSTDEGCLADGDRARLATALRHARLDEALATGDRAAAEAIAAALLAGDPRDAAALAVVTVADALALFEAGEVVVEAGRSPEPVEVRRFTMPADGDWGDVLFAHPPAAMTFTATLPAEPTALIFRIANDPQSWEWGGDGVTFVVTARPAGEAGPGEELLRHHVGNAPEERRWHDFALPMDAYAGQTVVITLATEVGPAGDGTGDWAGWDSPRIRIAR